MVAYKQVHLPDFREYSPAEMQQRSAAFLAEMRRRRTIRQLSGWMRHWQGIKQMGRWKSPWFSRGKSPSDESPLPNT
jgi:hypothetical protein